MNHFTAITINLFIAIPINLFTPITINLFIAITINPFIAITINLFIAIPINLFTVAIVQVTVSNAYANKVCGLCGNMNGQRDDDFTLKGTNTVTNDPIAFAESYLFDNPEHNAAE